MTLDPAAGAPSAIDSGIDSGTDSSADDASTHGQAERDLATSLPGPDANETVAAAVDAPAVSADALGDEPPGPVAAQPLPGDEPADEGSVADSPAAPEQAPAEQAPAEHPVAAEDPVEPAEPTPSEPTPSEPTPSEPTPSEPTPSEPTPSGSDHAVVAESASPQIPDEVASTATPAEAASVTDATGTPAATPSAAPTPPASAVPGPPIPRPGPPAHPTPPAAPAAAPVVEDRSQDAVWGRVDDEGGVWLRTAQGERHVGSYPGASPEEALAYFGRKYDELAGQVTLLEQRIRGTELPAKEALASVNKIRDSVVDANVVGDLAGLLERLQSLLDLIESRRVEQDRARSKARAAAKTAKEKIVAEAEELSTSTTWKVSGDRLRTLLDEWKAAPRLDRKTDDELWKRFSTARTAFDKNRRQHFAALDEQREEARVRKEKIVKEAESLKESTEWGPTAGRYRQLMSDWKAAGRAARGVEDELWERFRAAQDAFFGARNALFAERDADQRENLTQKEALADEAEKLLPITDYKAARATLRSIQERWEAIGHVPRDARDRVEGRLRRVEEAARGAEEAEWRRTNPEARARAEATVNQLRTSIAGLEADAEKARAAGNERKATEAETAAAARREWLVEAEKTLAEFS